MEFGDLCPWCPEADCPSTAQTRPGLAKPAAEAPPIVLCRWCFGAGGYRVPCHGCTVVGPVMVAR